MSDDEDYFDGGSGDDDGMRIEEGSGGFWNEKKPDHDEEDNGPWVDWSPPVTKDQGHNKKKPVVVHDHEKPMDNEIDDTRHRTKVGSGSRSGRGRHGVGAGKSVFKNGLQNDFIS